MAGSYYNNDLRKAEAEVKRSVGVVIISLMIFSLII